MDNVLGLVNQRDDSEDDDEYHGMSSPMWDFVDELRAEDPSIQPEDLQPNENSEENEQGQQN